MKLIAVLLLSAGFGSLFAAKTPDAAKALDKLSADLATVMEKSKFKEKEVKNLTKYRETLKQQSENAGYGKKVDAGKVNGVCDDVQKIFKSEAVSSEDKELIQNDIRNLRKAAPEKQVKQQKQQKNNNDPFGRQTNPRTGGASNRRNPF